MIQWLLILRSTRIASTIIVFNRATVYFLLRPHQTYFPPDLSFPTVPSTVLNTTPLGLVILDA